MTIEEINKILDDHENEYAENDSKNPFLAGLNLLSNISQAKNKYSAEHDIFYAASLNDLPKLDEKTVIKLNRFGFHFDDECDCFAYFT